MRGLPRIGAGAAWVALGLFSISNICAQSSAAGSPETDFQLAEKAFADGRYREAAEGYAKLAELSPDSAEIHAKLGLSRFFGRDCSGAAPAFGKALRLKPGLETAEVLLSICLSELGRYKEALPGLEKGYRNPPKHEGVKRLVGLELQRSYLSLGKYAQAAEVTAQLHLAYPGDPEVLFHANRTYRELAVQALEQLTRVAPNSVWGHQVMGEAYESRQYYDLAITEYRQALEKDPRRPGLHFRLGQAMLGRAEDPSLADDALEEFKTELRINPSHASAAYQAGEIYRRKSQMSDALRFFELAAKNRPDFEEAQIALGRVLLELNRPEGAREHLEEAVQLNQQNAVSRYLLARAYRELGEKEKQRTQLSEYRRLQAQRKKADQEVLLGVTRQEVDAGSGEKTLPSSQGGPAAVEK